MRSFLQAVVLAVAVAVAVLIPSRAQAQSPNRNGAYTIGNSYRWLQQDHVRQSFPYLRDYRVLAPITPRYNCISHTVGAYDRWVWPGESVSDFNRLYGRSGYRRGEWLDARPQSGVDKIVLYGQLTPSGGLSVTHAARQHPRGGWTSKLGQGPLIWHPLPGSLTGRSYGFPIAIYTRPAGLNQPNR
jgi:hypothetical protein